MTDLQCPARVYVGRIGNPDARPAGVKLADTVTWSVADVDALRSRFEDLADRYRGESVLVLVDDPGLAAVEEWFGASIEPDVALEADASGWRVVRQA